MNANDRKCAHMSAKERKREKVNFALTVRGARTALEEASKGDNHRRQ